jgi:hypothetical protein
MPLARYVRARNWRNLLVEADATLRSRGLPLVRGVDACRFTPDELKGIKLRWPAVYEWEPLAKWLDPIRVALARLVEVEISDIPQPYNGIFMIQVHHGSRWHDVAIDYHDYTFVNEECASRCVLYFKMQHLREGYGIPHVVPGGYVTERMGLYRYLPYLRQLRDQRKFHHEVYGRFSISYATETRRRAITLLQDQGVFRYQGGSSIRGRASFHREIARSRVCIDLPGNGPFCHRLIDYIAVGACIVSPPHPTVLNAPLIPGTHIIYTRPDMSDLVELCRALLDDESAVEALCRNSRRFFDQHLHRDSLAAYYLRTYLERVVR